MRPALICLALIPVLCLSVAASACDSRSTEHQAGRGIPAAESVVQPPRVDLSTPDLAVKSYWALRDSSEHMTPDTMTSEYRKFARWRAAWRSLFAGEALAVETDTVRMLLTYAREIVNVEVQSPTHAVVTARIRNTSPIPAGATPTELDAKERRDGQVVRYILDRDSIGWRIAQAQFRYTNDGEWENRWSNSPFVPTLGRP